MKLVEAVNKEDIAIVERKFRLNGWDSTADLWRIGVNLALRITDLLAIRMDQLNGEFLTVIEGKTCKPRKIKINETARAVINKRRIANPDHIYLFQSTGNRVKNLPPKPLGRQIVTKRFQEVGRELGLDLGTHSMRKTRGKAMYEAGVSVEQIAKVLNHSNTRETLRYIGITQKTIDSTYTAFEL